jgi:hypothetical protein
MRVLCGFYSPERPAKPEILLNADLVDMPTTQRYLGTISNSINDRSMDDNQATLDIGHLSAQQLWTSKVHRL